MQKKFKKDESKTPDKAKSPDSAPSWKERKTRFLFYLFPDLPSGKIDYSF